MGRGIPVWKPHHGVMSQDEERLMDPLQSIRTWERSRAARRRHGCVSTERPVWALIGRLRAIAGNVDHLDQRNAKRLAWDYDLPLGAVRAAWAYYQRHEDLIDARLLLEQRSRWAGRSGRPTWRPQRLELPGWAPPARQPRPCGRDRAVDEPHARRGRRRTPR